MAKTRCPPRYKNLGLETFGNKKKVTEEILTQFCKNDEWLRRQVEELRYLTPPAVRKSLRMGETFDEEKSWGCMVGTDGCVQFSDVIFDEFSVDFSTEEGISKWFDDVNSTVEIGDGSGEFENSKVVKLPHTVDVIQTELIEDFGTGKDNKGYNSAWYVGFDKSKNFYLRPHWIKNWKKYADTHNYRGNGKKKVDIDVIPAIARAQTFKVPTSIVPSGKKRKLLQVDLALEYNGTPTMSSSPLLVQIWKTYKGWVNITKWDTKEKKAKTQYETIEKHILANGSNPPSTWQRYEKKVKKVYYTKGKKKGELKEKIVTYHKNKDGDYIVKRRKRAKPYSNKGKSIKSPLAEYEYNPEGKTTKGGEISMVFPTPPELKGGESYAIVLLSPLNNWENCPRWGGWGRNCKRDALYNNGDAFISYDNGRSWKRYGKNGVDEGIEVYNQGKWTPQDYRFRCYIRTRDEQTEIHYQTNRELYLKPIYSNPIWKVEIHPNHKGGNEITYQLSTDGDNWEDFNEGQVVLEKPSRVVFIKAIMTTSNNTVTPEIKDLKVQLWTNRPNEMYVRSKPYTPDKFGTILGASVWGRVFAPYTLEDESLSECRVDIIQKKENVEYFDIIELDLFKEKVEERGVGDMDWLDDVDDIDDICEHLTNNPEILDDLKYNYNMYILPHEMEDGMHNLSFAPSENQLVVAPLDDVVDYIYSADELHLDDDDIYAHFNIDGVNLDGLEGEEVPTYPDEIGGIKLNSEVAYPIINCQLEPEDGEGHGKVSSFGEWYDYTFDYLNNELVFKRDTLNRMGMGSLAVTYNPVFIKDLKNDEVGVHYDEDGNVQEGLVLDYFKERFEVTEDILEDNRIKLRVDALDPIRQVYIYTSELDEPVSLVENHDYFYNIDTHEIEFPILTEGTQSSILNLYDIVEVVYTPNLDDTSICVGYNVTRTDTNVQCYIDDYYIEYKVG